MALHDTVSVAPATASHTDLLGRLLFWLAVLALCCAPTQLNLTFNHHPHKLHLKLNTGADFSSDALSFAADAPEYAARTLNHISQGGVFVKHVVPHGIAEKAGLKNEDMLTEYNGVPITDVEQFEQVAKTTPANSLVKMTVVRTKKPLQLAPCEILLVLAFAVWGLRALLLRKVEGLPSATVWLLLFAGVMSVIGILALPADNPETKVAALPELKGLFSKEMLKYVLYLLVGVTVFRAAFTSRPRLRLALLALLATTSLAVLLAVGQRVYLQHHYQPDATKRAANVFATGFTPAAYTSIWTPIGVCSTFGSWNEKGFHASRVAYAGFLGLVLPFALALLVLESRHKGLLRLWLGLLLLGGAVTVLAGYLVPGILLGLLVTGVAMGWKVARYVVLGVAAYLLLLVVIREPVPATLAHTPAAAGFHGFNYTEVLQQPVQMKISAEEAANPNLLYNGENGQYIRHMKKFWGEQLAALRLMRGTTLVPSPQGPGLFGVGMGTYQAKGNIQDGYSECISPVAIQHLESDAQSGYLLMLVNAGLFGLAALLAVIGSYLGHAWQQVRRYRGDPWAAALLGAMVACAVMSLGTNLWVRGSFMVLAALFALLENREKLAPEDVAEP